MRRSIAGLSRIAEITFVVAVAFVAAAMGIQFCVSPTLEITYGLEHRYPFAVEAYTFSMGIMCIGLAIGLTAWKERWGRTMALVFSTGLVLLFAGPVVLLGAPPVWAAPSIVLLTLLTFFVRRRNQLSRT